jgi:hypothetical protein
MAVETKHTPGPWLATDDGTVEHESGMLICTLSEPSDFPCRDLRDDGALEAECEANARLVASSPELARDYAELLAYVESYAENAEPDDPVHELLPRYQATLAKATGAS